MNNETEVRTKEGRLIGYKCINNNSKMLAIITPKGEYKGAISADDLYMQLNEGPFLDIEKIKNRKYRK